MSLPQNLASLRGIVVGRDKVCSRDPSRETVLLSEILKLNVTELKVTPSHVILVEGIQQDFSSLMIKPAERRVE